MTRPPTLRALADQVGQLTQLNQHIEARMTLAQYIGDADLYSQYRDIQYTQNIVGYLTPSLDQRRNDLDVDLKHALQKALHFQWKKVWGAL